MKKILLVAALFIPALSFAKGAPKPSELDNALAVTLLVVIIGLLIVIGTLAYVVLGAAQLYLQRFKETKKAAKAVLTLFAMLSSVTLFAQAPATSEAVVSSSSTIGGMSQLAFYSMVSVIGLELIIIFSLLIHLKGLLATEKEVVMEMAEEVIRPSFVVTWWNKLNSFKPMAEEADLQLDHDYDGIKELDNRLPPWWLYGFYITIIFAGIYLWRYHVSHTAPLSEQELAIAMEKAEIEKEAYLKNAANNVDENTVILLTDASALEAGKKVFTTNCAACHGADGGGTVGPNLTDDNWLHGGSVQDVFKTIKYGVQEKGMKSWKDDLSPVQIAQVTSFIRSLHGTKPANGKEPQGEIYIEKTSADSSANKIAMK